MYKDRNLEHPVITQIERNGYPDAYPDDCLVRETRCAWCTCQLVPGENVYVVDGDAVCPACFEHYISETPLTDLAAALHIHYEAYA